MTAKESPQWPTNHAATLWSKSVIEIPTLCRKDLYRLTGGWDGVREALGITLCTLSYKDKCAKINREHAEKQAKIEAEYKILVEVSRKKNAERSARYAAEFEALLAAKRSAKRKADNEWGKLFFI